MSSLDLTRDWLKNVLRPYPSRDIVQTEVLRVLQRIPSLAVKTDAFTFDSGSTALLLLLHGTLPITYRGALYHIPMHIWFPHEYPRAPPMVFVVPTKDMGVRKGREVEPGGRVREEALHEAWARKKDLDGVVAWLTEVFSAVPPVYAKPAERRVAPAAGVPGQTGNGAVMNGMGAGAGAGAPVQPPAPVQGQAPAPSLPARPHYAPPNDEYNAAVSPPPPTIPGYVQQPPSRQSSGSYPTSHATPPPASQSPPVPLRPGQQPVLSSRPVVGPPVPQPLTPAGTGWAPQIPYAQGIGHQQQGFQSPPPHGYLSPLPPHGYQSPQPAPQSPQVTGYQPIYAPQQYAQPPTQGGPQPQGQPQAPQPPAHPHWAQPSPSPANPMAAAPAQPPPPPNTLAPPARTLDLLSSPDPSASGLPLDDAPPPVPPSKPPPPSLVHLHHILLPHLDASLPPVLQGLHSSKAHLIERREDLASGEPAIRDEMARLEAVKKVCDTVGARLDEVVAKGSERVADLESRGDVSVDEVVCSISIVHNQLVDLVAEDNAISDTIYHVTRALDAERIDLDRYMKAVRSLAREQYMKRALIERISSGMGGSAWSVS